MQKYNPKAKCPKCGCKEIRTTFLEKDEWLDGQPAERDLLHRSCTNCGYHWNEAPLDSKVKEG